MAPLAPIAEESKNLAQPVAEAPPRRSLLRKSLRPIFLAGVVAAIVAQVVVLSPSSVEEARDASTPIEPESLISKEKTTLVPGLPKDRIPEYSVERFNYISTHGTTKDWNLVAERADMYNREKIVHARTVQAFLYDPDGRATRVTGKEAKYLMASPHASGPERDLEIFGDVKTTFPDGFEVRSEYMRYQPDLKIINIPNSYTTDGQGRDENDQVLGFTSRGLTYAMRKAEIKLHQSVRVTVEKAGSTKGKTLIESDRCVIDRENQLAHFTMNPERPPDSRFVRVTQPSLFSKGRSGDLKYGNFHGKTEDSTQVKEASAPPGKLLNYIILYGDVLLKERSKGFLRYATAGRADFDAAKDIVVLTEFPQVYQDQDTVTGDRILLHRDTDIVEVDHSNSFSQGGQEN